MRETPGILDPAILAELRALECKKGFGVVARTIDLYLRDASRHVEAIRAAIAAGDTHRLRERAHALKGTSGSLGVLAVTGVCDELERMAINEEMHGAESAGFRLEQCHAQARIALELEREKERA